MAGRSRRMATEAVLVIDQGTTVTAAFLFDRDGQIIAAADQEFPQYFPQAGWVEHDPEEIWQSVLAVTGQIRAATAGRVTLRALGITNQRETTVVWDRVTGKPIGRAIVWQCRRTAPLCEELRARGLGPEVQRRTGLVIDAYFSATKIRWLLDHASEGQRRAETGALAVG